MYQNEEYQNKIARVLKVTAAIIAIICFIGGIILGDTSPAIALYDDDAFNWSLMLQTWVTGFIACIVFLAFGEIVQLLDDIKQRLGAGNTLLQRTAPQDSSPVKQNLTATTEFKLLDNTENSIQVNISAQYIGTEVAIQYDVESNKYWAYVENGENRLGKRIGSFPKEANPLLRNTSKIKGKISNITSDCGFYIVTVYITLQ